MNICKNGLPEGNVFEYSSFLVLNYEKKWYDQLKLKGKKFKQKDLKRRLLDIKKISRSLLGHMELVLLF